MAKVIGPALFIAANVVSGGSFAWAAPYLLGAGIAVSIYQQKSAARKAARNARDAYNAGLTDRMQMVDLRPDAPRTLALGRVRAVEGIRRRWVSGTNSEKMTLIVSFAGHEIDAFETFWFNDTPLTIDGSGYVQTAPYLKGDKASGQASGTLGGTGAASVTLSSAPVSGSLWAIWSTGTGESTDQGALTIGGTGVNITLSGGPAGAPYYVTYQTTTGTSTARIRSYLGTAAQNVGADLAAEYPGKITSADRFAGIALAVIDLDYDPDVYPQGIPNITATFRGAKCLYGQNHNRVRNLVAQLQKKDAEVGRNVAHNRGAVHLLNFRIQFRALLGKRQFPARFFLGAVPHKRAQKRQGREKRNCCPHAGHTLYFTFLFPFLRPLS